MDVGGIARDDAKVDVLLLEAGEAVGDRADVSELEARVGHNPTANRIDHPDDLGKVEGEADAVDLLRERAYELLLAPDPAEVSVRVDVARAHEGKRADTAHVVAAGVWKVQPGARVLVGAVHTNVDASDGIDDLLEAREVDFGVVVDGEPGVLLDRADHESR